VDASDAESVDEASRLAELHTSYQHLLDEVRRHAARRLLSEGALSPAEVGFLLGYEEINSFSRAFHGWEGVTPEQWRRARLGGRARPRPARPIVRARRSRAPAP
jgi:AraC-like DNA-binding protein